MKCSWTVQAAVVEKRPTGQREDGVETRLIKGTEDVKHHNANRTTRARIGRNQTDG